MKIKTSFMVCMILGVLVAATPGRAQTPQANADALLAGSKWADAAAAYRQILDASPGEPAAWSGLGQALQQLKQYDQAIAAYQKALDLRFRPVLHSYFIADAYAAKGDRQNTYVWLDKVAELGGSGTFRQMALSAPEFASMASDPKFTAIMEKMRPCTAPEYRQFDFWLGDWAVEAPAGQPAGTNLVTSEQSGCLLVEHWSSTAPATQTGTSFNFYDRRDKKWHQIYLDNSGDMGAFPPMAGEFRDGKMVLLTDSAVTPLFRWTWAQIAPGKVTQVAEQSTDGGKTWMVTWDSVYIKKK